METENENKEAEKGIQQKNESGENATNLKDYGSVAIAKGKEAVEKTAAFWNENKKTIIILVLAIALSVASVFYREYKKNSYMSPVSVKEAVQKFIEGNVQPGTEVEVADPIKESGLYKVTVSVEKQSVDAYVSLDGKKLFPQAISLTGEPDVLGEMDERKTEAENKSEIPEVDLYVMSYCPFGIQAERGILPVVEALGNKIKFNLKFVGYTMHGQKEIDENMNQYCIQKIQPEKLSAYLKCFWKKSTGTSEACMKSVGINAYKIKSCVSEANKQFSPTEKNFALNKEDNDKYGVEGSPAFVVNGTVISTGRDSESFLKAVCSGFVNQPEECAKQLSSEVPGPGFDDEIAEAKAQGAATNSNASCGE